MREGVENLGNFIGCTLTWLHHHVPQLTIPLTLFIYTRLPSSGRFLHLFTFFFITLNFIYKSCLGKDTSITTLLVLAKLAKPPSMV